MSLNLTPKITWTVPEYGVKVWLQAILKHDGCDVADIEGFALSHPDSADLMSVCLVGPTDPLTKTHVVGPELSAPWPLISASRSPLATILGDLLWAEARKTETRIRLQDAWEEAQADARAARAGSRADYERDRQEDAA